MTPPASVENLLTAMLSRRGADPELTAAAEATLRFAARHDDPLSRRTAAGHLTASGVVVTPDGRRVLLTLHRRLRIWLQTGGHCEPGEELVDAAYREALEETGLRAVSVLHVPVDLDVHRVPCRGNGVTTHFDVRFAAVADGTDAGRRSAESIAVRWFPVDALPATPPGTARAVRAAAALIASGDR